MKKVAPKTRSARIQNASQKRREQEKHELRELILKAAGEEFLEKGYDSFSLRRVAERIGYTPTTIYLYFRNKDDLLLATVQDGFGAFDRQMEETAVAFSAPLERIEALGRAYIQFGIKNPALYRLMFMQRSDFYFMPRFGEEIYEPDHRSRAGEGNLEKGAAAVAESIDERHLGDATTSQDKSSQLDALSPTGTAGEHPRTVAMALLVAAVEEAIAAGTVKRMEPIIAADVLWAGAHGLTSLAISPLISPEHAQKIIGPLLTTLIDGIKTR